LQESSMEMWEKGRPWRWRLIVVFMCIALGVAGSISVEAGQQTQQPAPNPATRPVGTIKTITGKTIVLTTDAGPEVEVQVQDDARLVRVEPGEKDLKNAVPLQLQDLQSGDRILVRGKMADDGKTVLAASVIAIKSADIATKQAHERDEWQRHGAGGLVKSVDAAAGAITISTNSLGVSKDVTVQVSKQTVLRRYATNSVKFDDAKPAPIDQIKVGDQLRARGSRNADGTQLTADEVVSGTFRNIAGTVSSIDASAGTITVMDLAAKKPVTVKVTADTQLRKLSPAMAQGIALRLKGGAADAPVGTAGTAPGSAPAKPADAATGQTGGQGGQTGGAGGAGRVGGAAGGARGGDLGQMLSRMPAATLADLQKGDAVMIVTTEGTQESGATAITLLAGVEPLLQASGASSILTPWTMSGAPGGDAAP
jgi:transcription antitermination factor NusG